MTRFVYAVLLSLVLTTFIVSSASSNTTQVLNQCIDLSADLPMGFGKLCVDVNSQNCFQLNAKVTLNNQPVWGPRQISALSAIQQLQSQLLQQQSVVICDSVNPDFDPGLPIALPPCSLCANVNTLKIVGDNLNFCGKFSFNCSLPTGPLKREMDVPCANISGCGAFGCPATGCNQGTCNSLGVCSCNPSHFGPDCSFSVENSCIKDESGNKFCFESKLLDCNTVEWKVQPGGSSTSYTLTQKFTENPRATIFPCKDLGIPEDCKLCMMVEDISILGNDVTGCTRLHMNCSGKDIISYPVLCTKFATNDKSCPNYNGSKSGGSSSGSNSGSTTGKKSSSTTGDAIEPESPSTSRTILMVMVAILGLGIVSLATYCGYGKYQEWKVARMYQYKTQPTSAVDDDDDDLNDNVVEDKDEGDQSKNVKLDDSI